jgi:hypothetical protein
MDFKTLLCGQKLILHILTGEHYYTVKSRLWWATESSFAKLSVHDFFHDTSNKWSFITKTVFTKQWVIAYENFYIHLEMYVVAQHQFSFRVQETLL